MKTLESREPGRAWTGRQSLAVPLAAGLLLLGSEGLVHARPDAPRAICELYPEAAVCSGRLLHCTACHDSTWPPSWNPFGTQVLDAMGSGDYEAALDAALQSVSALDADGDGMANLQELQIGTAPGDADDVWPSCVETSDALASPPPPAAGASLAADGYDFERALGRVGILFCGRSPSFDELATLRRSAADPEQGYQQVHEAVDACLDGAFWRDVALRRIADPLVTPVSTFGPQSNVGVVFGDYEWDYRLFAYAMTGDRDVRDLLLADYHVQRREDGSLEPVEGVIPDTLESPLLRAVTGGQPVDPEFRAGMLTTQWFITYNGQDTSFPRITAAQAYRAYLGFDIANEEGLWPGADEPRDIDDKGVDTAECALCHSTLDSLTYAFTYYEPLSRSGTFGSYNPQRPPSVVPGWEEGRGELLGQPATSVVQWAQVAAESDAFKRNVAMLLFRYTFEREPTPAELPAFDRAWRGLPDDGWSANGLIHQWVDLSGFGAGA